MSYRPISYSSIILALTEVKSIFVIHWVLIQSLGRKKHLIHWVLVQSLGMEKHLIHGVLVQSLGMENHLIHWVLVQSLGMEKQRWMKLLMLLSLNWWKHFLLGMNLLEKMEKA